MEVLAESASEDFRSQSAAASMVGQTALLREIVDGVVVEGESRNGGSLSGKLVVPGVQTAAFSATVPGRSSHLPPLWVPLVVAVNRDVQRSTDGVGCLG